MKWSKLIVNIYINLAHTVSITFVTVWFMENLRECQNCGRKAAIRNYFYILFAPLFKKDISHYTFHTLSVFNAYVKDVFIKTWCEMFLDVGIFRVLYFANNQSLQMLKDVFIFWKSCADIFGDIKFILNDSGKVYEKHIYIYK